MARFYGRPTCAVQVLYDINVRLHAVADVWCLWSTSPAFQCRFSAAISGQSVIGLRLIRRPIILSFYTLPSNFLFAFLSVSYNRSGVTSDHYLAYRAYNAAKASSKLRAKKWRVTYVLTVCVLTSLPVCAFLRARIWQRAACIIVAALPRIYSSAVLSAMCGPIYVLCFASALWVWFICVITKECLQIWNFCYEQ